MLGASSIRREGGQTTYAAAQMIRKNRICIQCLFGKRALNFSLSYDLLKHSLGGGFCFHRVASFCKSGKCNVNNFVWKTCTNLTAKSTVSGFCADFQRN